MGVGVLDVLGRSAARLASIALAMTCLGAAPVSDAVQSGVQKVRFGGDGSQTRVVLELDRSAHGRVLEDGAAGRLALALDGVDAEGPQSGAGLGLVRSWSVEHVDGGAALHLALTRPSQVVRRFLLAPGEGAPSYRYVIDLAAVGPAPAPTASSSGLRLTTAAADLPIHARKVVVIDAGHGGKDPGAAGERDQEKDLTLAAAKALKRRLERDGRYRVVLTRGGDEFIALGERVRIARNADADLFISLHADADADHTLKGATVYTLSDKGSDRVARKAMTNDWFINVSMPSRDHAVNQILLDLTQRATRNQSSAFAEALVDHVSNQTQLLRSGHRDAGYVVLLAPDVPAVLLEMGFITNGDDEAALADPARRTQLMNTVGDAIDDYFSQQRRVASR
jgi:N-acetylmuramoyl-L-alanine amidase